MKGLISRLQNSKVGTTILMILVILFLPFVLMFKWKEIRKRVTERLNDEAEPPGNETSIYLEKSVNGNIHFVRLLHESNSPTWVKLSEGMINGHISNSYHGHKSQKHALDWLSSYSEKMQKEGYSQAEFVELHENTVSRYDDWDWHDTPDGVDGYQRNVPSGLLLGWAIHFNLISKEFYDSLQNEKLIQKFNDREITGPYIFEFMGSVLDKGMLNVECNKFLSSYFDSYFLHLHNTVGERLESIYHIEDNWENFEAVCKLLNKEMEQYKTANNF